MFTEHYQHKQSFVASELSATGNCLTLMVGAGGIDSLLSSQKFLKPERLNSMGFGTELAPGDSVQALDFFVHEFGLSKIKYEQCHIILVNSDVTLIPQAFAGKASVDTLNFINGRNHTRHIQSHLPGFDVVAGFDADTMNTLERYFPNAHIKHCAAVTLGLFANHHSLATADMFLVINGKHMELCARNEKGLLFYNVYKPQNDEDVLYYLLFAMEQFALNPLHVKLALAANVEMNDTLIKSIQNYLRHVQPVVHAPSLQLSGEFSHMPSHMHFQLLNQFLCE